MPIELSPYRKLLELYFPSSEWERASCILAAEMEQSLLKCGSTVPAHECIILQDNLMTCNANQQPQAARSYGLWQILDVCWDPTLNSLSPFTREQWAQVLDPNVNTWMASVIWSINGWRAWTTCPPCEACAVPGGPIPYPRHPVAITEPPPVALAPTIILVLAGLSLAGLALLDTQRQGRR